MLIIKNLKKFFGALFALLLISPCVSANGVIGEVYTTDIGALIDEQPISSYNFQGYTYVVAEDLRGYGFNVEWDAGTRTLMITQNADMVRTSLTPEQINIKKSDIPLWTKLFDVYETDIKTYIHGREIAACNIDGRTLIKLSDLGQFGEVVFDEEHRLAKLNVIRHGLESAYSGLSDVQELSLGDGITYTGQTEGGVPNGIGKIYDKSTLSVFPGTVNDKEYTGTFRNGEKTGYFIDEGYYTYTIGSDRGTYYSSKFGNKTATSGGVQSTEYTPGFMHEYSDYHGMKYYTDEYLTSGAASGFYRRANVDYEYLYGMLVTHYTTYTGGDLNIELRGEAPRFERFGTSEYSSLSVIDTDGNLYTAPGADESYANAVYRRRNALDGNYRDGWVLARDNKLYLINDENEQNDVLTAENVASASSGIYADNGGGMYELTPSGEWELIDSGVRQVSGSGYVMYLKDDGSVWTYRSSNTGGSWIDGEDHSQPVQRGENARYVSTDGNICLYIDSSGTLWGFGMSYSGGLSYIDVYDFDLYDYEKSLENYVSPVKLGEDFVSVKAGDTVLGLKSDGSLWGWGSNEYGQIVKGGDEYILSPVKLAENVKDYEFSYGAVYVIYNDGSLWFWGHPYSAYSMGSDAFYEPAKCEFVYNPAKYWL